MLEIPLTMIALVRRTETDVSVTKAKLVTQKRFSLQNYSQTASSSVIFEGCAEVLDFNRITRLLNS